ncbi:MAG TPA: 2,3-bisphosphoglycerate-independent phosphoglycerate mutase [Plasticicumulans sp.]|uniref:2,3-bisphosphoglycerate-independent phosphoglycerate mutase n=1 Tax=Plasticicumulans sp. TaxID=2307179 RepID=UPI002CDF4254|nr:2,3-bisphosphoglycerate-independent phosphoglycerate mutase [Plasticicumulans sp.]HND97865.1 2,3-bisphosphoglycerate-independent phosphoglycerate mutase [Plasticicumulans sp.]HNG48120.1 2,3-bisphosphoglycerate-independent phosphoglycerate mutase [Plasticicumulans sp.]HNK32443.1 2,3-bisphosphoglycerate-independent phosphoglycerate mutase [Plasticicumulans sp.]
MPATRRPLVLAILDGWGYSEDPAHNAILGAHTPNWDRLWATHPHTLIDTSGLSVGLPAGQMGNSEVGHMNLGAGRVVYQELTRIGLAIEHGGFFENPVLCKAVDAAVAGGGAVHVMGLLSPGGVHSHEEHLQAMVRLAAGRGAQRVYVHAFLDGRDTPPRSAADSLAAMDAVCAATGVARIATLVGRYYAMDRDNRWERVQAAYELIVDARGAHTAADAAAGLAAAYGRGENDEFVAPTVIGAPVTVADGDAVVFMNFRADRARELTRAFVEPDFSGFARARTPALAGFVCLTQYQKSIPAPVAYAPEDLSNVLGDWLAQHGRTQLRIAETEKYAHVTFFFSGGREPPYPGEERILIPSPKVATYDLQPQMSAPEVTDRLVEAIRARAFDLIVVNYANPDMVGHTGLYAAAVQAVEAIDAALGRLDAALAEVGGEMLVTADHGNVESMWDADSAQANTAHTTNVVPFLYVSHAGRRGTPAGTGALCDVAPTVLKLLNLPQPPEMTGRPLLALD